MKNLFKIDYSLKTTSTNNGEFVREQKVNQFSIYTETNDLNEIFTDLFDLHRYDGIIGIEIIGVEEQQMHSDLNQIYKLLYV
jgi:hypothetical protein